MGYKGIVKEKKKKHTMKVPPDFFYFFDVSRMRGASASETGGRLEGVRARSK